MLSRRNFAGVIGCGVPGLLSRPGVAAGFRRIPQRPSVRVIVDDDFAGDSDGRGAGGSGGGADCRYRTEIVGRTIRVFETLERGWPSRISWR